MSIVPYNSNNEIVYHDPNLRILVIHNNQENTIRLLDSTQQDRFVHGHDVFQPQSVERADRPDICCPNCGVVLADFVKNNKRAEFKRLSSTGQASRGRPSGPRVSIDIEDLVPSGFMHHDYFKLLANLPYEPNVLAAPDSDSLPSDIFNQGYFDRFFRRVPPGILGSGAHAQVYKVMHMLKNILLGVYAVKRINVGDHSQFLDQVLNEVLILYELTTEGANENNLIRYNHVWMELGDMNDLNTIYLSKDGTSSTKDEKIPYVYILQQYCDGGHLENLVLDNFLREQFMSPKERLDMERQRRRSQKSHLEITGIEPQARKWLSDFEIWKFIKDIANGVNYLHSKGILHRDLKPSNCLLESKYNFDADLPVKFDSLAELENAAHKLPKVLVSDFGEGKYIDKQHLADLTLQLDDERRGNTGTIEFTDPKLWIYAHYDGAGKGRKFAYNFTKASDIYSLGIILCYLCVGELPFADRITDRTDPEKIRGDIASWREQLTPESFSLWFLQKSLEVRGDTSEAMAEFDYLIYQMVVNDEKSFSSGDIMNYLESMKWGNFIGQERKHSEATITEVPKSATTEDTESVFEGEILDLTSELLVQAKNQAANRAYLYRWNRSIYTRKLVIVSAYMSSIAVLELLNYEGGHQLVLFAKFCNIAGLSAEVLNGGSSLQNYYGAFCVAFTYYTFHRCRV